MKRTCLLTSLIGAIVLAGCATQTREVTYANGSQEKESTTGVLQSVQGYDSEGVGLDGTTYKTTIQNITGDVQMAQVLSSAFINLAMIFAAEKNTNLWPIIASNQMAMARSPFSPTPHQRLLRANMNKPKPAKKHRKFLFF